MRRPRRFGRALLVGLIGVTVTQLPAPSFAETAELPYSEDFGGTVGAEWTSPNKDTSPSGEGFLGRFGDESVTLSLTDLPDHSLLRISFDLYVIGTMDGSSTETEQNGAVAHGPDVFTFALDGGPLKTTTFSNVKDPAYNQAYPGDYPADNNPAGTGATGADTLGYPVNNNNPTGFFGDTTYHSAFLTQHTADTLTLSFSTSGLISEPGTTLFDDESWGLDNVVVTHCDNNPTDGDDVIVGTSGDDILCGGDGSDSIDGRAGKDIIYGGPGNDTLNGGPGDDTIDGGSGDDAISGGPGNDMINGGQGADGLVGGPGSDVLDGGPDAGDVVTGGPGNDTLRSCDEAADMLHGEQGTDTAEVEQEDTVTGIENVVLCVLPI